MKVILLTHFNNGMHSDFSALTKQLPCTTQICMFILGGGGGGVNQ